MPLASSYQNVVTILLRFLLPTICLYSIVHFFYYSHLFSQFRVYFLLHLRVRQLLSYSFVLGVLHLCSHASSSSFLPIISSLMFLINWQQCFPQDWHIPLGTKISSFLPPLLFSALPSSPLKQIPRLFPFHSNKHHLPLSPLHSDKQPRPLTTHLNKHLSLSSLTTRVNKHLSFLTTRVYKQTPFLTTLIY